MKVSELQGAMLAKRRDDPTYISWSHMMQRCYNLNADQFMYYGGRGIEVCRRWHDFTAFVADMGERQSGGTLDRINPQGDYEPANCRWASHKEQCNNRRSNVSVTWKGETRNLKQWADQLQFPYKTLWMRYKAGWSTDRLLSEPLNVNRSASMRAYVASKFGDEVPDAPHPEG
jgi:hypothetical protein